MECSICLREEIEEPVVTRCGHVFCWPCLFRWAWTPISSQPPLRTRSSCPACKSYLPDPNFSVTPIYCATHSSSLSPSSSQGSDRDRSSAEAEAAAAAAAEQISDDDDDHNNGIMRLLHPLFMKLWKNMRQDTKPSIWHIRLSSIWLDIWSPKIFEAKHDNMVPDKHRNREAKHDVNMVSEKHRNREQYYMWWRWRRGSADRAGSRLILHEVPSGPNPISNDISS